MNQTTWTCCTARFTASSKFSGQKTASALDILANEGDVAVIISDQRMPYMSGTEFLSLTATQYPDIIRIILTGYTDVEDLVEAINSGKVFKYVTKPWDDDELKAVVRQAVDTHNVLKTRTRELRRSLRQESLLNAITSTIRSALSSRQILQTIGETVGRMFEVSGCVVRPFRGGRMDSEWFVYIRSDDETANLTSPSDNGHGDPAVFLTHAAGTSVVAMETVIVPGSPVSEANEALRTTLAQAVWETHGVQIIQDVETDDRLQGEDPLVQARRQVFADANIRSSLIVPLICQTELVAVLALHQCEYLRTWQDDEVQLLTLVADQAALALSQARSYEQVRALAKREALINTITTTIRSSLDPQEIFAAITQQLGQALHADGCALSLWTREDEFVQCVGLHDASRAGWSIAQDPRNGEVEGPLYPVIVILPQH